MPAIRLNVSPVTSSQPPQTTSPARSRSVRGARRVNHSPATSSTSAAGSNHATWPPTSELNIPVRPVAPQPPPCPPGPPPPAAAPPGLVTGQPAEAVLAEGQLEDRVVLRATDVRPRRRRPHLDGRHPPAA